MEEDHETKTARDEGVEKLSCQIEWRGSHVNLVYYNGKQVLRAYSMVHVTAVLHVRSEEHTHILLNTVSIYLCAIYNFILTVDTWRLRSIYIPGIYVPNT